MSSQPKVAEDDTSVDSCDIVNAVFEQDQKHYGEAMKSENRNQCLVDIIEELEALKANDVWKIVVPPRNAHVLHNQWVYKTKSRRTEPSSDTRLDLCIEESNKSSASTTASRGRL